MEQACLLNQYLVQEDPQLLHRVERIPKKKKKKKVKNKKR